MKKPKVIISPECLKDIEAAMPADQVIGMWLKCEKCGASKEETWD